ncbi:MAG: helix-turn-helix transcriptional regulator [Acidimicrobiales bacterium]
MATAPDRSTVATLRVSEGDEIPEEVQPRVTYTVPELAARLGVSSFCLYASVRDGTCPVPPIRIGRRRIVFARAAVDRLLGLDAPEPA